MSKPKFERIFDIHGSSALDKCRYDYSSATLDLKLVNGNIYRYRNVDAYDFARFISAGSPGTVYNETIRRRKATKLRSPNSLF